MAQLRDRIRDLSDSRRRATVMSYPPPVEMLSKWTGAYEYNIEDSDHWEAEPPCDPVKEKLQEIMRTLSRTDMCFAASECRVWKISPATEASPHPSYLFYAIKEIYEEFPISFCIQDLSNGTFLVDDFGTWRPIREWLSELPNRQYLLADCRMQLLTQQKWWDNTGLSLPLDRVPVELRTQIYQEVLGGELYPDASNGRALLGHIGPTPGNWNPDFSECWENYGGDFTRPSTSETRDVIPFPRSVAPNLALLRVSKGVREEALFAAWSTTMKNFINPETFVRVVEAVPPPPIEDWGLCLTKIHLNFQIPEWFEFLGVGVGTAYEVDTDRNCGAQLLGHLAGDQLEEVKLTFPDPYTQERKLLGMELTEYCRQRAQFPSCQKDVVDLILNILFPNIKHIRRICLAGCIKTVTKKKWDYFFMKKPYPILNNEDFWDDMERWGYNREKEMAAIKLLVPSNLTACECPNPCDKSRDAGITIFDPSDEWKTEDYWDPCMLFRDAHERYPNLFGPEKDDLTTFAKVLDEATDDEWTDEHEQEWLRQNHRYAPQYARLPLEGSRIKGRAIRDMRDEGQIRLRRRRFGSRIDFHLIQRYR